ncbi:MAG: hypothetical protein LBE20_02725 [Deltaproteobacteria bacterium]|jgi:hypothetical protein|nr:hypothetical protein [Deltaproteobacteria bacterium]
MLNIKYLIPDVEDAFWNLYWTIKSVAWCEVNNRFWMKEHLVKMHNSVIDKMLYEIELIDSGELSQAEFYNRYFADFKHTLYDLKIYQELAISVEWTFSYLQTIWEQVEALNAVWKFKLFNSYQVNIQPYSAGAGYRWDNDIGIIAFGSNKALVQDDPIFLPWQNGCILHEIIHLGIEELIVKRFDLQQEEKERLVENLCLFVAGDNKDFDFSYTWSDETKHFHQECTESASYIDTLIEYQGKTNFIEKIGEFIKNL